MSAMKKLTGPLQASSFSRELEHVRASYRSLAVKAGFVLLALLMSAGVSASHFEGAKWTDASLSPTGQFQGRMLHMNSKTATFRETSLSFQVFNADTDPGRSSALLSVSTPNVMIDDSDPGFEVWESLPSINLNNLPGGPAIGTRYAVRYTSCCRIDGIHNNAADSYSTEVVVVFDGVNWSYPPVFFGPPLVRLIIGQDFSFLTSSFIQSLEPVTFELLLGTDGPDFAANPIPGMNFNTLNGNFSMTAADTTSLANPGFYVAKFRAVTESGSWSEWDIMFRANSTDNNPPVLDPIPGGSSVTISAGSTYSVPVRGTDPDADQLVTLRGIDLPANATLAQATGNPANSTLEFTPSAGQIGTTYPLVIEAKDNHPSLPLTDTRTVHVTVVNDASSLPIIEIRGNGNVISDGDNQPSSTTGTSFGSVLTGDNQTRTYTIHNVGQEDLILNGSPNRVAISGLNPGDFTVLSQPSSPIAAGSSTSFEIEFIPAASGSREANVRVDNNDTSSAFYSFAIGGTGTDSAVPAMEVTGNGILIPDGDISPRSADNTDFGSVDHLTGATLTRSFQVVNSGSAQLDLTASPVVSLSGANAAEFTVIQQPASTVAPADASDFLIEFNPSGVGERRATVSIPSNDSAVGTYTYDIRGFGIEGPNMRVLGNGLLINDGSTSFSAADNTSFGSVDMGDDLDLSYTIENAGSIELNLTGAPRVSISGTNAADFSVTVLPDSPVTAFGGTTEFTINFSPSGLGNRNATINIASDDPNAQPYNFDVRGQGSEVAEVALSITRSDTASDPLFAGQSTEFTVTLDNLSVFTSVSDVQVSSSKLTPSSITCAQVAAGNNCQLIGSYVLTQADVDAGQVTHFGSATTPGADDPADVVLVTPISQVRDLSISKVLFDISPSPIQLGSTLSYLVYATNNGNVTLNNVVVTDAQISGSGLSSEVDADTLEAVLVSGSVDLLAGADGSRDAGTMNGDTSTTCPSVSPGASCVLMGSYVVVQSDVDNGGVSNTAFADADQVDEVSTTLNTPIPRNPSMSINLDRTPSVITSAGQVLDYTITVTNLGDVTLAEVELSSPTGLSGFSVCPDVAPGDSCVASASYSVTQADMDAATLTTTAAVEAASGGQMLTASDSVIEDDNFSQSVDLSLSKSLSGQSDTPVILDTTLDYEVVATNTGNVTLTDIVVSDDLLGTNVACATLAPSETCVLTGTYTVTQADVNAGEVVNTASATVANADDPANVVLNTPVSQVLDIAIVKTFDGVSDDSCSTADALADPELDSLLCFTITATNSGTVTLSEVIVTDPLNEPADSANCNDLAPGGTCVLQVSYEVVQADVDAGVVINTASASSLQVNDGEPISDSRTVNIPQNASMEVVKTFAGFSAISFEDIQDAVLPYTVTMTNVGNVTLTNVVVSDAALPLSPASESCASVSVGDTCILTGTYAITTSDIETGEVENTASVTASEVADAVASNTVTVPIPNLALLMDLGVVDSGATTDSPPSGWAEFHFELFNIGGSVSENSLVWIEVHKIDDLVVSSEGYVIEAWNATDEIWVGLTWDELRGAWLIGDDDDGLTGIELPSGHNSLTVLRANFENANYEVTVTVESIEGNRTYVTEVDRLPLETDAVELTLVTGYGVGTSGATVSNQWSEFTARVQNAGGTVPENVLFYISSDGAADPAERLQYWDDSDWATMGWDDGRQAWFFDPAAAGFGIPAGDDRLFALRADFANGIYTIDFVIESLDSVRTYLTESAQLAFETVDADLSLSIVSAIPAIGDENLDQGWAYFDLSLANAADAGDVPEGALLYLDIANVDFPSGDRLQYWTGSAWADLGWDSDRAAWFHDPASVGFSLTAGTTLELQIRVNFDNASYVFGSTVEGEFSGQVYGVFSPLVDVILEVPQLVLTPGSRNFGDVRVGSTLAQVFTLSNTGASFTEAQLGPITDPGLAYSVVAAGTSCSMGLAVTPASPCEVEIRFAPPSRASADVGLRIEYDASLSIESDYNTAQAALQGAGIQPALSMTPTSRSLNFGDVQIGQTSAPRTIVLSNSGTASLTIGDIENISLINQLFENIDDQCNAPVTLQPAESCSLVYVFKPQVVTPAGATDSGSVAVISDAPTIDSFSLVGRGVNRDFTLNPESIDFGSLMVDTDSGATTVTLTNTGDSSFEIEANGLTLVGADPSHFQLNAGNCASGFVTTIPSGASCQFSVSFQPELTGEFEGVVEIATNASVDPFQLVLSGTGIQAGLGMTPADFDFGPRAVGADFTTMLTITNTGDLGAILSLNDVTFDGDGVFTRNGGSCAVDEELDGGDSCTIGIRFAPDAVDDFSSLFTVNGSEAQTGRSLNDSSTLAGEGVADRFFRDRFEQPGF
jgi:hypothetical protein